jgi:cell division transport system ATP-binding protein
MSSSPADALPLVLFDRVVRRHGTFRFALNDVSFSVARGEFVLLTGASGAGKSTALRLIAALEAPSSGRVVVGGTEVGRLKPRAAAALRRSMGIVLQDPLLLEDRHVLANVMLPAQAAGEPTRAARERAQAALARVGLDALDVLRTRPQELSGGEQQRVALARAIVNRPALVLADEPTAHLDAATAASLLRLLEEFAVSGVTVIVASHGAESLVPARARVIGLHAGRLVP